jgi:glutaredoxin
MRMRLIATIALGVAAIASMQAGAQQLYRWVDKNGKVNYTQDPPPKDAAKSVQQRRLNPGQPDTSPQMPFAVRQAVENFPVTLYTSTECASGCKEARELLNKRGVPFREFSVSDEATLETLKKLTGDTRVPVMQIGRQAEKGFQEQAYNSALDNAGYPRTSSFAGKPPALPSPKPQAKPPASAPVDGAQAAVEAVVGGAPAAPSAVTAPPSK